MSPGDFDHGLLSTAVFEESNRVRAANGVPPMARDPALDSAADEQAVYLSLVLRAEHANPIPGEQTATERVARAGLQGRAVAENAVMMPAQRPADQANRNYTYAQFAALLLEGWMNSTGHRENLLNPGFTLCGCAARIAHGFRTGDLRVFAIQVFFIPLEESSKPSIEPILKAPR
jgi:uncharacterized protein YkwD